MEEIAKVFGIDWRLLIIQAINFGLIVFILSKFLYKPILKIIDTRKNLVEEGLSNAKKAQETLNEASLESEKLINTSKNRSEAILRESKEEADNLRENAITKAEADRETIIKEAKLEAIRLKESAIKESEKEIARLSILAAEKVLREK